MNKLLYKVTGLIVAASLSTPLFAFAQTDSLSSQVQSLLSQIQALQQQLKLVLQTNASSSRLMGDVASTSASESEHGSDFGQMHGNICPQITRDLRKGARGADVSQLQNMLVGEGFMSASSSTGFFGPLTERALSQFQKQSGIVASSTGVFGSLTRGFIQNHCRPQGLGVMGSSTHPDMNNQLPLWRPQGTSTVRGGADEWNSGTSSVQGPNMWMKPMVGSSTRPMPCPHMGNPGMGRPCEGGAPGDVQNK